MSVKFTISPLNEVCSEIIDCVNKTAPVVDYETPYKMIRTTNVKKGYIDVETVRYVTKETFDKWTRRAKPRRNDIILTREAPLGEIGLLRSDDNVFLGQRLIQYRAKFGVLDQLFLYYAFQDSFMQSQIMSYGSGATVEHLRIGDCETIKVKYPDLQTQKKIASILSAYDDLIENNNQRIKLLEEMAEEIYKEWFVRMRFPGYKDSKFFDADGTEVPHGSVGALPEGWDMKPLEEILITLRRKPKVKSDQYLDFGSIPVVDQGEAFIAGYTDNKEYLHNEPLPLLVFGDHTRRIKYVDFPFASGADGTQLLYPKNPKLLPTYFYLMVKSIDLSNFHYSRHFKYLKKEKIILPSHNVVDAFNKLTSPFLKEIDILKNKNKLLQETRDLLLPRLISGKLSVEDLDIETTITSAMAAEPEMAYK